MFALLIAPLLAGSLLAQRAGMTFQGNAAALPARPSLIHHRSFSNGFFPRRGLPNEVFSSRFHRRHDGFGAVLFPYFLSDYQPLWYEQPDVEAVQTAPPVFIEQREEGQVQTRERPPAKAQVIEIPVVANSTTAKPLMPTIFILTSGERLETRRFLLTATSLSVSVDRHQRTIPLGMIDLDATIAVNRERGMSLQIPADRNEILLSF
jgi:hypothetical protein